MSVAESDPRVAIRSREGGDVLVRVTLALFVIGLGVSLVLAWRGHQSQAVGLQTAWHHGPGNLVELTLVREDETRLACASALTPGGLACAFDGERQPRTLVPPDAARLRPYATVSGDLLLGAGLWASPALPRPLPAERFTVVCDFEIVDLLHSVALRWASDGVFDKPTKSLPAGRLRGCALPP
ncbi:MAG: uncharacterized protein JWM82_4315 [Myxococcales bacterium]|nr:uncharacterized protein [Myxococcales bacterium]